MKAKNSVYLDGELMILIETGTRRDGKKWWIYRNEKVNRKNEIWRGYGYAFIRWAYEVEGNGITQAFSLKLARQFAGA